MRNICFELIIRKQAQIKSRQWWNKTLLGLKGIIKKFLSKRDKSLLKDKSCCILITDNKEIQKINKKFREINKPTDVLSFPLKRNKQKITKYLGDIVISADKTIIQAKEDKISPECELRILLVHGFLHLLGYDHKSHAGAKIMFNLQDKIVKNMKK